MGDAIRLRDWVLKRIESGKILTPKELNKLYQAYHRMRMWEAECHDEGGERICPQRS